jgi:hypothetical protein
MYTIERAMLWFYVGQKVSTKTLYKWYTPQAVAEMFACGYLKQL